MGAVVTDTEFGSGKLNFNVLQTSKGLHLLDTDRHRQTFCPADMAGQKQYAPKGHRQFIRWRVHQRIRPLRSLREGRLSFIPGTVKLWESSGRVGGLPSINYINTAFHFSEI
jgi:hypothetical protein